ncbi:hypothetical protein ACFU76_07915 [Streptomyces sp. NPDC057539]|uniref:hypothetical protein n=1 Tax=Streptomyces sp. NPDC057539 TaxID=3346159 RepID=UPI0036CB7AEB
MGNLWIGTPGALHEIDRAAKTFDRSAELGVNEFRSLSGRVTLTRNPLPVRRIKLGWELLAPRHARLLDRLARRLDGPGPLVLVDPASGNVLDPRQAAGKGDPGQAGLNQWFKVSANGTVVESATAPGTFSFAAVDATGKLAWRARTWSNFPVAPGMRVSFHAPAAFAALPTVVVQVDFKKADGTYLSTVAVNGPLVMATVPAEAALVTPCAAPGVAGTYSLAGACLTYGGAAEQDVPGDGMPPMAVTGYSDTPARPQPYRSISLDLVEVSGAAG